MSSLKSTLFALEFLNSIIIKKINEHGSFCCVHIPSSIFSTFWGSLNGMVIFQVNDFTAKTFWVKVQTGRSVNREKAYLMENQFRIKLRL